MRVDKEDCQDFSRALTLEWLEANGRGGFASGTVVGASTRRYHALLLTARTPPTNRVVLVNQVEEWLDIGEESYPLSTNLYPGAVHPEGYRRCIGFTTEPWPTWDFDCDGTRVRRELLSVSGRDIVILRWTLSGGPAAALLRVRPKLTGRDYHATHHENSRLSSGAMSGPGVVSWQPYQDVLRVTAFHSGNYRHAPDWYRRIEFPIDRERGLDYQEDWWSPGEFSLSLTPNESAVMALTTEPLEFLDAGRVIEEERGRRIERREAAASNDSLAGPLRHAADAYLVQRGAGRTIIAGYPWFADWGRDTFISLPGLCLATGRSDEAWTTIASFASYVSEGMVPNRFPDSGEAPEYNTIDASLWFIDAVGRYAEAVQHEVGIREVAWPAVKQILDGYRRGTRYGIRMEGDGLVTGGVPGVQLTWMDVKIEDWVVTPRHGKPVEIQALWVRALKIGEALARRFGEDAYAEQCRRDRSRAVRSFKKRFWYEEGGYLYDVIDGPDGDDASLRPNQVYAIALTDDLVSRTRGQQVLRLVQSTLLTPVGLRTLSPNDPRYRPRYEGGVIERDSAYHQGSVWPFLLGPFVTAWVKSFGRNAKTRADARRFLCGLEDHLREACLGHISELFDAEAPHRPRGCFAQAWSIAEPLRVLLEDLGAETAPRPVKTVTTRQTVRGTSTSKRPRAPSNMGRTKESSAKRRTRDPFS
ncbi:MAG TPA: amylo-alpha-1,6-glucosidase [Nitrospira sp.]|nr:amylo-alpha-1,6-glucosidase [Nitrospira sp.]